MPEWLKEVAITWNMIPIFARRVMQGFTALSAIVLSIYVGGWSMAIFWGIVVGIFFLSLCFAQIMWECWGDEERDYDRKKGR